MFRRFCAILSVCFLLLAALALWRIVAAGGGKIWYVPLVLVAASGIMAATARKQRYKEE